MEHVAQGLEHMATNHGVRGSSPFLLKIHFNYIIFWDVAKWTKAMGFEPNIRRFESSHPNIKKYIYIHIFFIIYYYYD